MNKPDEQSSNKSEPLFFFPFLIVYLSILSFGFIRTLLWYDTIR
jgi:hypothetical protein